MASKPSSTRCNTKACWCYLCVLVPLPMWTIQKETGVWNLSIWQTGLGLAGLMMLKPVNGTLKLGMPISTAYRTALDTWASWVESMVNTSRTHVFFRTFEPSHWRGPGRSVCRVTQLPISETNLSNENAFSDIISEVVSKMKVPVTILHVTNMGASRSDAHVGKWSDKPFVPDCSHWCLPGVPDTWNELVFTYLQLKHTGSPSRIG